MKEVIVLGFGMGHLKQGSLDQTLAVYQSPAGINNEANLLQCTQRLNDLIVWCRA